MTATVPVIARYVQPGEILAANPLVAPRGAIIVDSYWIDTAGELAVADDPGARVRLQVLDSPAWPLEDAQVTEVLMDFGPDDPLNVLVTEVTP